MAKTKEQLRTLRKNRRTRLAEDNKRLKNRRNWYPISDAKRHFKRKTTAPRPMRARKDIQPGQVLIILSGRFRGRRVVFLKSLKSNLLLVTGPYKLNGVPLKRVNQAYVLPTRTRVNLSSVPTLESINDAFFKRPSSDVNEKAKSQFFDDPVAKKARITDQRKNAQNVIDTEILKAVSAVPQLRDYLRNRFALKNGDKPHAMMF
jgi:large subunit ribosomal protein L6e